MTAGQPFNQTATAVFYIYLNSFPYLSSGYGAALSLILAAIILVFTVVQMVLTRRSRVSTIDRRSPCARPRGARLVARLGRPQPLPHGGDLHLAICTFMLAPLVLSVLASLKTTAEAAAHAADLLPARAEPRQLRAAVGLPGRPADLPRATASATALLTIAFTLALTIPAGYALARFPIPGKEGSSSSCCSR